MLRNLAEESLQWLFAPAPSWAFRQWLDAQEPDLLTGLAGLGLFAGPDELEEAVVRVIRHRERIRDLVLRGEWRQALDEGVQRTEIALNQVGPDVRLYVLIGPARSNASAAMWQGRGLAFVWLESWLGRGVSNGELQDLELRALPFSVSHELAHALRYGLPGTRSPVAQLSLREPLDFWEARPALPLREVMYDEGLATRFSLDAFPEATMADSLLMSADQVAWLDEHWRQLLADRERRWNLDQPNPPFDWFVDALAYVPERSRPPWSIERAPTKWAYYVGLKWAQRASGEWSMRLRSAAPRHR